MRPMKSSSRSASSGGDPRRVDVGEREVPDVLVGPVAARHPGQHLVQLVEHRSSVAALGEPRARRAAVGVEGGQPHAVGGEGGDHRAPAGVDHLVQRRLAHGATHHVARLGRQPDPLGELLALERQQDRAAGHLGVALQGGALGGPGTPAVEGTVHGEQPAQLPGVVVDRGGQQVERVPPVGALGRHQVGDVAVLEDLVTHPVVGHEPQGAPLVGLDQLLLQHLDLQAGALHHGELGTRGGHHLEEVAAAHADRGQREARQRGRALGQHPEGGPGGCVGPGPRPRPVGLA